MFRNATAPLTGAKLAGSADDAALSAQIEALRVQYSF
jgi:hypothetical protein